VATTITPFKPCMVFSPLVKRQVPFLHVPVWCFQIKIGLLSGDRFVVH